jgi:CO/xanthine dehydrogenase Mo-binding subunit
MSGSSIRLVCAEVRAKALDRAALRLNCSPDDLTVVDGQFLQNGEATGQDYWTVAGEIDFSQAPTGAGKLKKADAYKIVGKDVPRFDLPAKITGAAYVHDVLPSDVLHARTLRQPNPGATLAALDEAAIKRAAKGELQIMRAGTISASSRRRTRKPHGSRVSRPRIARSARRRARARRRTWRGSPCRGPTSRTRRWVRPARWPSSATAV